ncbi:MAG TPA: hypothetical protein PKB15_03780 [Acidimicrobiia bacterium]|nr:hypothetical protein [Acidimicrobiia bacterium]
MRGSIQYAAAPVGDHIQRAREVGPNIRLFSGPTLNFAPLIAKTPPIVNVFKSLVEAPPHYQPKDPQITYSFPGFYIHATLVHVLVAYGTGNDVYSNRGNTALGSLLRRVLQEKNLPAMETAIAPVGVDVLSALLDAVNDVEKLCAAVTSHEAELERDEGWTPIANGKTVAGIQLSHEPDYDNAIPYFHRDEFPGCTRIQFPGEAGLAIRFNHPRARAEPGEVIAFRGDEEMHSRAWVSETDPQACRPGKNLDRTLAMATMF